MNILLFQPFVLAILDKINEYGLKFSSWLFGLLTTFPGWLQAIILAASGVLILFGVFWVIKKSFKLIIGLGVFAAIIFALYWFFLKK